MSEHLLIDPNELYKLYDYRDVNEYYNFTFLEDITSIEIDIFYDVLNSISIKQLDNLNRYIYKQWTLTRKNIEIGNNTPKSRKKELLSINYNNTSINTKVQFNNKLKTFGKDDKIMSIFIMNQLLKFLYPCK